MAEDQDTGDQTQNDTQQMTGSFPQLMDDMKNISDQQDAQSPSQTGQNEPSGYRLAGQNDDAYTIAHPDGSTFDVAKDGISDDTHQMIGSLPQLMSDVKDISDEQDDQENGENGGNGGNGGNSGRSPAKLGSNSAGDKTDLKENKLPSLEDLNKIMSDLNQVPQQNNNPQDPLAYAQDQMNRMQGQGNYASHDPNAMANAQAQIAAMNPGYKVPPTDPMEYARAQLNQLQGNPVPANTGPMSQSQLAINSGRPVDKYPYDPAQYGPMANSSNQMHQTSGNIGDIQQQSQARQAQAFRDDFNRLQGMHQIYQDQQADINNNLSDLDSAIKNNKINPNRLFQNLTTGNKILAGIGLFLGGFSSAMTGQPNYAMIGIQRAIDNDIDAQKTANNNKMNLYKMNLDRYHNSTQAELATRLTYNQMLSSMIGNHAMNGNSQMAPQLAQQAQAQIAGQMEGQKQSLALMGLQHQLMNGNGLPFIPPAIAMQPGVRDSIVTDPTSGQNYMAKDTKSAQEMRSSFDSYPGLVDNLEWLDKNGKTSFGNTSGTNAEAQVRANQVPIQANQFFGLGALTGAHADLLKEMTGNPSSWSQQPGRPKAMLDTVNRELESKKQQYIMNYKGGNAPGAVDGAR